MHFFKPQSKRLHSETMSAKNNFTCRKCSTVLVFMLFFQVATIIPSLAQGDQNKWQPVNQWMLANLEDLGGRAILLVHDKYGNIVYSHSENNLSRRQKMVGKFLAKRQGNDDVAATANFDENSRQRIASCSKWLSAALVMTFVDEGTISLDDSIGKFLPIMVSHGKGNIKIWQCLSHLTGIKQVGKAANETIEFNDDVVESAATYRRDKLQKFKNGGNKGKKKNPWTSMAVAMDSIARQPMEGEPGKTFHYGNAGLQIAAAIIEKVGGRSFEALFQERIAKPCGMRNTDFGDVPVPLAAGGAFSTPTDYMRFLDMILNNGSYKGKQVITSKSIAAMQVNYAKGTTIISSPAEAGDWGYGFGEWVMEESTSPRLTSSKEGGKKPSITLISSAVTSPGLFGSFPWVENKEGYCAFLFTFNIKSKGRNEKYKALKKLVDGAFTNL